MERSAIFVVAALVAGCSTIQSYETLAQPTEKILTASIGGAIFRLDRSYDLPNAYGKADIWGGRVDAGFYDLR